MPGGECISVHIGQAGARMGAVAWEQYCREQNIMPDGKQREERIKKSYRPESLLNEDERPHPTDRRVRPGSTFSRDDEAFDRGRSAAGRQRQDGIINHERQAWENEWSANVTDPIHNFFCETGSGQWSPRAVFADLDPDICCELGKNRYKKLYSRGQVVSGQEDAASLYSKGYYTSGARLMEEVEEALRDQAESCDSPQGFFVTHSIGGGTGSGLATLALQSIRDDFCKVNVLETTVLPSSQQSDGVVAPYNAVLATHKALGDGSGTLSDIAFVMDNEAMFNIFRDKLHVDKPTFEHTNAMIAQIMSFLTSSMREKRPANLGHQYVDWTELRTNLVPHPRIHFVVPALSPIMSIELACYTQPRVDKILHEAFKSTNQLARCDLFKSYGNDILLGSCVLFKGKDVNPLEINRNLRQLSQSRLMHDMNYFRKQISPQNLGMNLKMGFTYGEHVVLKHSDMPKCSKAMCMLTNSTGIRSLWDRINRKFDMMFRKNAFVHHFYEEGLEMDELLDARMNTAVLEADYRDLMAGREDPSRLY